MSVFEPWQRPKCGMEQTRLLCLQCWRVERENRVFWLVASECALLSPWFAWGDILCNDGRGQNINGSNLANCTFYMFTHKCTFVLPLLYWGTHWRRFLLHCYIAGSLPEVPCFFCLFLIGQHGFRVRVISPSVGIACSWRHFNHVSRKHPFSKIPMYKAYVSPLQVTDCSNSVHLGPVSWSFLSHGCNHSLVLCFSLQAPILIWLCYATWLLCTFQHTHTHNLALTHCTNTTDIQTSYFNYIN